jgi:hypothetical protein
MRKRIKDNLVCSGRPDGRVMDMSSRELEKQVEWGMKAIECCSSTGDRAKRGLMLGKMCEDAGHPVKALSVWLDTLSMVRCDNYEWEYIPINSRFYSFDSRIAYTEMEELGRNIDRVWRQLGHDELAHYEGVAEGNYRSVWLAKYGEPYWDEDE